MESKRVINILKFSDKLIIVSTLVLLYAFVPQSHHAQ